MKPGRLGRKKKTTNGNKESPSDESPAVTTKRKTKEDGSDADPLVENPSKKQKRKAAKEAIIEHSEESESDQEEQQEEGHEHQGNGIEEEGEVEEGREEGEGEEGEENELDDVVCVKCESGDDPSRLILCDECDRGWHLQCLSPPLSRVPRGDWFCADCSKDETVTSDKEMNEAESEKEESDEEEEEEEKPKQRLSFRQRLTQEMELEQTSEREEEEEEESSPEHFYVNERTPSPPPPPPRPPPRENPLDAIQIQRPPKVPKGLASSAMVWQGFTAVAGQPVGLISLTGTPGSLPMPSQEWPTEFNGEMQAVSIPITPPSLTPTDSSTPNAPTAPTTPPSYPWVRVIPSSGASAGALGKLTQSLLHFHSILRIHLGKSWDLCIAAASQLSQPPPGASPLLGYFEPRSVEKSSPPQGPFMEGYRFTIIGYPPEPRILTLMSVLTQEGGAVYKELLLPSDIDLIVIHPAFLHKLVEVPHLLECRLNPTVRFVKGIEYLERCLAAREKCSPLESEELYPRGGCVVVATDEFLQTAQLLPSLLSLLPSGWFIKIHKTTLKAIHSFASNSPTAKEAAEVLSPLLEQENSRVSLISDEEESKSQNSAIPSEVLRSALKLSFLRTSSLRHVVLLTGEAKLQKLAKSQQLLCMDLPALKTFFRQQSDNKSV